MPQGVIFYKKEIDAFILKMTVEHEFKRMRDWETISMIKEGLAPFMMRTQKDKSGVETCLVWNSKKYDFLGVGVWLSYVEAEGKTRDEDFGWVFIKDKRLPHKIAYFRFPRRRTKNFLKRMEDDAFICKELIEKYWAPNCKKCDAVMTLELVRGKVFHEVHFVCPHGDRTRDDDICQKIPENKEGKRLRKLLLADIQRYHRMTIKNDENGIFPVPARVKRFLSKNAKKQAQDANALDNPHNDGEHHFFPDE